MKLATGKDDSAAVLMAELQAGKMGNQKVAEMVDLSENSQADAMVEMMDNWWVRTMAEKQASLVEMKMVDLLAHIVVEKSDQRLVEQQEKWKENLMAVTTDL